MIYVEEEKIIEEISGKARGTYLCGNSGVTFFCWVQSRICFWKPS